jgi:hypothetical protein
MRRWIGPAAAVAIAIAVIIGMASADSPSNDAPGASEPDAVEITSDVAFASTLEELVADSDLVVHGHVVSTDHGRIFGNPDGTVIESRLVAFVVDDVLRRTSTVPDDVRSGSSITVEEPGWLEDGTPLIVDGVPPSAVGDEFIWFLQAVPSPALDGEDDAPAYVLASPQGHFSLDGDRVTPSKDAASDPVATALAALGRDGLGDAVRVADRAAVTTPAP